jgi:hypothetical protein
MPSPGPFSCKRNSGGVTADCITKIKSNQIKSNQIRSDHIKSRFSRSMIFGEVTTITSISFFSTVVHSINPAFHLSRSSYIFIIQSFLYQQFFLAFLVIAASALPGAVTIVVSQRNAIEVPACEQCSSQNHFSSLPFVVHFHHSIVSVSTILPCFSGYRCISSSRCRDNCCVPEKCD